MVTTVYWSCLIGLCTPVVRDRLVSIYTMNNCNMKLEFTYSIKQNTGKKRIQLTSKTLPHFYNFNVPDYHIF